MTRSDGAGEGRAIAGPLLAIGRGRLETSHGPFAALVAQNVATRSFAIALACGDPTADEPILARLHSSCITSETFGGCDCDCVEQLDAALGRMAAAGRGVVFYLMQEGRGAGFAVKARDRMLVQASRDRLTTFEAYAAMGLAHDLRVYDEVGWLRRLLGLAAPMRLLTNNPDKVAALGGARGLDIDSAERLAPATSPWNTHYIDAKRRSGHALDRASPGPPRAEPPEEVRAIEPEALDGDPRFVRLAEYLLPVLPREGALPAHGDPLWFRLHAFFDLGTRSDRVVLERAPRRAGEVLVRLQHESLLERFPLRDGPQRAAWSETVRRIAAHGAGVAAFVPADGFDGGLRERTGDAGPSIALLANHLRGRTVRLLVADSDPAGAARRTAAALRAAGVRVAGEDRLGTGLDHGRPEPRGAAARLR